MWSLKQTSTPPLPFITSAFAAEKAVKLSLFLDANWGDLRHYGSASWMITLDTENFTEFKVSEQVDPNALLCKKGRIIRVSLLLLKTVWL